MPVNGSRTTLLASSAAGPAKGAKSMEMWEVYLIAFGFVSLINLSSIMGIIFFPMMKKPFFIIIMRTMIGLAIGSLGGSALFHLIPAAFHLDELEPREGHLSYLPIALIVWIAAWIVMTLECVIKICVRMKASANKAKSIKGDDNSSEGDDSSAATTVDDATTVITLPVGPEKNKPPLMGGGDSTEAMKPTLATTASGTDKNKGSSPKIEQEQAEEAPEKQLLPFKTIGQMPIYRSTMSMSKVLTETEVSVARNSAVTEASPPPAIKTVAWIIIIGNSIHNLIDGVSIGTAFSKNLHTGIILSCAILCEEFPHELGDFAILINSGLSVKKALLFNFMSALTCYVGLIVGIILGEISWESYIFAFAAGIFLYASLGDMVPEVTSLVDEVSETSPCSAVKILINHNVGILIGIIALYLLAVYEPE